MNAHVHKAQLDFDFNDAWAHIGFAQAKRQRHALGKGLFAALVQAGNWLVEKLRPISAEEAFLAKAQNIADLERRIRILQTPEHHQSNW